MRLPPRSGPRQPAAALVLLGLLWAAACRSDLSVPADARIDCSAGPCPAGWTCNAHIGRCIPSGQLDNTPPSLSSVPAVAPPAVRAGVQASLAFDVSEELRSPPRVTLRAGSDRALTASPGSPAGRRWTFLYTPVGDEPQGVDCPLLIDLEDLQGLTAVGLAGGSMRFDFAAPTLTSAALTGSPARAGGTLRLTFAASEPLATDPVVHLGAGLTMARDPSSTATTQVYTWTSDGSEPEGSPGLPITVDLADPAGNAAVALPAGAAVFDRTPPALEGAPQVSPAAAGAGALVRVTFTASETLGADPVVKLGSIAMTPGDRAGRTYTYGHVAAAADGAGSLPLTIRLVDLAGNDSGPLPAGAVALDFTAPLVSGFTLCDDDGSAAPCAATQPAFSAQPGHDRMKVSFALSEPPGTVRVQVGAELLGAGGPEGCVSSANLLSWVCRHQVVDALAGASPRVESTPVALFAADPAGNAAFETDFATLDFQPPALAGTPYFERCDGYAPARAAANDLWVKPVASFSGPSCPFSGCGLTGPVRVHFALDEASHPGPGGVALDDGTRLDVDGCQSTPTQLVAVLGREGAVGDRRVVADVRDARGNGQLLDLGRLRLDATPPAPPDTAAPGRVLYRRYPWGADATGGAKAAFLEGGAGAVAPGAWVAAYDGQDPSRAAPVGRTQADGSGAFGAPPGSPGAFPLSVGDIPEVFVVQEDPAGNVSAPALVWDALWTATTGFKLAGSSVLNPNRLTVEPAWRASRDTPAQLEPAQPAGVATRAGTPVATEGQPDLRPLTFSSAIPSVRGECAMDHDPVRGQSLLFGGRWSIYAVGNAAGSDTWLFDGSSWSPVATATSPPSRSGAGLAHDGARDRHVLFGGTSTTSTLGDTWEFDGADWRRACWPGCSAGSCSCTRMPSPRYGASMFFDVISGRAILFGGTAAAGAQADTWTWDGVDWTPLAPAHSPPPSSGALLAVSPELGQAMLLPGGGTWIWDGADWSGSASIPPWGTGSTDAWWDPSGRAFHAYFAPANLMATWDGTAWAMVPPPPRLGTWATSFLTGSCSAFDREQGALVRFGGCVDGTCRTDYSANQNTVLLSAAVLRQLTPATAPGARAQGSMADVPDDGVAWLSGGRGNSRYSYQDNWTWDGASWASDGGGPTITGLFGSELAWVGNGHLARFGGDTTGGGSFPGPGQISTWVRTAPGWTFALWGGNFSTPGNYPEPSVQSNRSATSDQAFAYDEDAGLALYFRGEGTGTFSAQWVTNYAPWVMLGDANGLLWTALAPPLSPATVTGHRLAWCRAAGGLVLFGGVDAAGALSDRTWKWSWPTTSWSEVLPSVRPPARTQPVLFCDRERGRLYAIGGRGAAGDLDDVWEFDGASWTPRVPAQAPPARRGAGGAFLSSRGRGLLFGGEDANGFRGDTWSWDGGRDRRPAHVFHARFAAAGADPVSLQSVGASWDSGALSFDTASASLGGTALYVWDRGLWRSTGVSGGSLPGLPGTVSWSTSGDPEWSALGASLPARLQRLVAGGEVAFAVAPLGTNRDRTPAARLATSYAEVQVRYRLSCLPAGSTATSTPRCCSGAASGVTCR